MMKSRGAVRLSRSVIVLFACVGLSLSLPLPTRADDSLTQHVDSSEQVVRDDTVIERGHVDLGPKIVDSKPEILARDDSGETPVWRPLNKLVFRVANAGKLQVPADPSYSFLRARQGDSYWVIPQTQNPSVVWLGWNTQDPELVKVMGSGATMTVGSLQGPGQAWLFLQDGAFGAPTVLYDSGSSSQSDIWVEANTHVHANWAFSAPGAYAMNVRWCFGEKDAPQCVSDTLRFVVGDEAAVEEARALNSTPLSASSQASKQPHAQEEVFEQGSNYESLLYALICVGLAVASFLVVSRRSRQTRRQIEEARNEVRQDWETGSDA